MWSPGAARDQRAAPQTSRSGRQPKGLDDFEIATCAWESWLNEERLHSELDDQTSAES